MDFDCRMMVYDFSHFLLGGVWVNQVQDPYLTMLPYLGLKGVTFFSMVYSPPTIGMRQFLVNHCKTVIIFLNNFDQTTTHDSLTIKKMIGQLPINPNMAS